LWASAIRQALARGIEVEGHLPDWPEAHPRIAELQKLGMKARFWRRYDPSPVARAVGKLIRPSADLAKQLRRSDADVIVVNQGSAFDLGSYTAVCDVLVTGGKPYVVIVQHNHEGPIAPWARDRMVPVFGKAAMVAFVSDRNRLVAERQMAAPIPKAALFHSPVSHGSFDPVPWPEEPGRMACVARLEVWAKGQDVLFEALSCPEWRDRDWRLTLCGDGPDRGYLEALARFYRIAGRVSFAGHIGGIGRAWEENEILLLPSRSEGTPLSLLEALVAGRPAVVTDVGDSARWVEEGETGFVADAPSAASFGRALERAWERRAGWREMGQRAAATTGARVDRNPGGTLLEAILRCRCM
jgi:glycosyltransferase involved in cell wall biosynthesis